jgi:outer membrane protein assembly factor BamE (lipoprotein component of BamABCDE complex)
MRLLLWPTLAVCGLSGCAVLATPTANKMDRLNIGMSREDVVQALGRPVSKGADATAETLYYRFSETRSEAVNGIATPFFVKIAEGKVSSFGRINDSDAAGSERLARRNQPPAACPPPTVINVPQ